MILTAVQDSDYPELAGQRYDPEMQDPRVSAAARNENRGPASDRAAVIAGRALRAASPHAYQPVPDAVYPHLVNPQCKCGSLDVAGYVRTWLATDLYERHVLAALAERRTPYPYDDTGNVPPGECETPASGYYAGLAGA